MILGIDTSGAELVLVLVDPSVGSLVGSVVETGRRQQGRIGAAIETLAAAHGGLAAVDTVAAVNGPGSHTGLRVGLAAAAGIVFARRLRVHPLASLVVAAHRARQSSGPVTALVAAGRGRVYAQRFLCEEDARRAAGAPRRLELAALGGVAPVVGEPELVAAATGAGLVAAPARSSDEALAAAVVAAVEAGEGVAYDGLRGEYGDDVT